MANKLQLGIENSTHGEFQRLVKDLDAVEREGKAAAHAVDGLGNELKAASTADAVADQKRLAAAFDETTRAAHRAGDAAQAAAAKAGKAGGWTEFAAKGAVAITAMRGIFEAGKKAAEGISFLADNGVESMQRLETAGGKLQESLVRAFDKKGISEFTDTLAIGVEQVAIPLVNKLSDGLGVLTGAATRATDGLAALGGVDLGKLRQAAVDAKVMADNVKQLADQQQRLANNAFAADFVAGIDLGDRRKAAADAAALAETKNLELVERELAAAEQRRENRLREAKTDDDEKHKAAMKAAEEEAQKILQLDAKIRELKKTIAAEQKAAREAEADQEEAIWRRDIERIEIKAQKEKEAAAAVAQAKADFAKKIAEAEQRLDAKKRQDVQDLMGAMDGKGGMQGPMGGGMGAPPPWFNPAKGGQAAGFMGGGLQLKGKGAGAAQGFDLMGLIDKGVTPAAVRKRLAERAAMDAMDQVDRDNPLPFDRFGGGDLDQHDPGMMAWAGRANNAKKAAAARAARAKAFRDFNMGNTSQADLLEAQGDLVNNVANAAEKSGKLGERQVQALRGVAQGFFQQAKRLDELEQQVEQINNVVMQVVGRGNNSTNRGTRTSNGR